MISIEWYMNACVRVLNFPLRQINNEQVRFNYDESKEKEKNMRHVREKKKERKKGGSGNAIISESYSLFQ